MPQQCLTKAVFQMRAILRRHDEFEFLDHHLDEAEHRALPGSSRRHEFGHLARFPDSADIGDAAALGDQGEIGAGARVGRAIVARAGVAGLVPGLTELLVVEHADRQIIGLLRGHGGEALFAAVWTLAALGIGFKLFFTGRFKGVSTAIYLGMGWLVVLAGKPLFVALSGPTLAWLFAGGAAYSLGTVFYLLRREWAHPVWHGFVLAGSACHFVAVSMQVLEKAS